MASPVIAEEYRKMHTAILFLVFNRPETTRQVFEAIRQARPPRLYVAADGWRNDRPDDYARCQEVRQIVGAVDWPCEVRTLFQETNLGCKIGVSTGISWFFSHEEEGIILEDDILPISTFFDYCEELLHRFRDDERVAMISGCNLIANAYTPPHSYFFSRYNHIWGWASWRRAWKHYDVFMKDWPAWRGGNGLSKIVGGERSVECYWQEIFDATYRGEVNTWDYQWTFACWKVGALCALPIHNQTLNLGFGRDATHTVSRPPDYVNNSKAKPLPGQLVHPEEIFRDKRADAIIDRLVFDIRFLRNLAKKVKRAPVIGPAITRAWQAMKNARA